MYAYDFEYDGQHLSDFGYIICSFDSRSGASTADVGSEITFITSPVQAGKRYISGGSKYEKCLETTFQICKNPALFTDEELEIKPEEFRVMSRWLNRREFLWFRAYDICAPDTDRYWVRASFTLKRIEVSGITSGIELDMKTDSPFCYGEEVIETLSFSSGALSQKITDHNDEIGETFPAMTITCGAAGELSLSNDMTGCECSVANCVSGEIITFSGDTKIIATSNAVHDLSDDFNFDFFTIGNTYANRTNTITASVPCTVELRYRPVYKDTL